MTEEATPGNGTTAPRQTVKPDVLLKELDKLWAEFGKGAEEGSQGGVVRACTLTWITVVEGDSAKVREADEMLAHVMRVHPSRAVVVLVREGEDRNLKGSVSAQCWRPFGSKQQMCIERILLETTRAGACDVPAVLRALLVADLPVVLYCRNTHLLALDGIRESSRMADRVVVDMAYHETECLDMWPRLPEMGRYVSDLAWDRIIGFRRAIASHFASPQARELLDNLKGVYVGTRKDFPTPESAYLLSWILGCLGYTRNGDDWVKAGRYLETGFCAAPIAEQPVSFVEFRGEHQTVRFVPGAANGSEGNLLVIPLGETLSDMELLSDEMVVEYRRRSFEQFLPETIRLFEERRYLAHK
jgi:glucose-6-phosphate dehydrogenase assembly protein OpcA